MSAIDAKLVYINGKPFWETMVIAIDPEDTFTAPAPWTWRAVDTLPSPQTDAVFVVWKKKYPEVARCFGARQADYLYTWRSLPCFSHTSPAVPDLKTELRRRKRARNWR